MKCPKCGDTTRKKMTGAVCDNYPCTWSTNDTSKFEIKLNGDMAQQFNDEEQIDPRDEPDYNYEG
tara:strand:- start:353 stop:547 length:195 start_codon:yes stop_codon:yes gene_type:complete